MAEVKEMVNHPQHYNFGKIEVIEVVEDWKLGFNLGNAVKYIGRCEHKGTKEQDIKKAIWYLERELKKYDLKDYLKDISNVDIKRFSALQPIEIQGLYDREWLCPSCRTKVGDCCEVDNFCKHCGQKIEFN